MKTHANEASIQEMANVLQVSRSGYYKFLAQTESSRAQANQGLLVAIHESHVASRQTYGSPRIHKDLCAAGHRCSRKRVARLMREAGIVAKMTKKFKVTTQVDKQLPAAPNYLQQDFKADAPNQKWVSDITYVWTREGWLYLAVILDLFSRKVVGMAMSDRLKKEVVMGALSQALARRDGEEPFFHHSDKGCQYTSQAFQALLRTHGIICSMSGTGNCFDNAVAESFFHTLKTEHIYFEDYATREQAKASIFEYIEVFYNNERRHSFLNYVSPVAFEREYVMQSGVSLPSVH
jgi:putative transposase